MNKNPITFSFGENWKHYLTTVSEEDINRAKRDIELWLGKNSVSGKTVIDIGSGSGIHSLAFYLLGAQRIYSLDVDPSSVDATKTLWEKERPKNWIVSHGSILDGEFIQSIGKFDIVYSWGVLHHTGSMWEALDNSVSLLAPGGKLWVALYAKGPRYPRDIALKQKYNASSQFGKRLMVYEQIGRTMLRRLNHFSNPFTWNKKKSRGMNVYHDIVDWLGGLPYEVASKEEVLRFGKKHGLVLERLEVRGEGANNIYVFCLPI